MRRPTSPINGGCYIAAANDCRVHTDPIGINVAPGESLENFSLSVGGGAVYD